MGSRGIWRAFALTTVPDGLEAAAEVLREAGAGGVRLEDADGWARAVAHFPSVEADRIEKKLAAAAADLGRFWPVETASWEEDEDKWLEAWRRSLRPLRVGRRLVILPGDFVFSPAPGEVAVRIRPGMAFGTGDHPTTLLCLGWLEELIRGGETVLDVGTGSGILAIAALRLGARAAVAVDVDPLAEREARENAAVNGVGQALATVLGDFREMDLPSADLVVANIFLSQVLALLPPVRERLSPGGIFVASGVSAGQGEELLRGFAGAGFQAELREAGGWMAAAGRML